jgi:hypothetical protein
MLKLFDGRNMATRPIPLIVDSSERKAIAIAASEQKPKGKAVNMPSGPRVGGVSEVFGTKISGGSSASSKGGVFNPGTGLGETI